MPISGFIEFSTEATTMPMIQVDGLQVEYTQTGTGADLLLLHSLLTELSVFEQVLPPLAASRPSGAFPSRGIETSGRRVTCINLPGFGASSPAEFASVADYADHVARTMDALKLAATTDVFGNGFGAFVALELAIRHGTRIGRLLVADTVAVFPEPARLPFRGMAEKVRANGMQAVLDTAIGRMFPAQFQAAHPDVVAERKARLAPANAACFARACLALAALDLRPRLGGIRNPTLVMCGALDQTTPPALAQEVAKAIPGALYREIAGSGHCPMLEQPETLVAAMSAFLGSGA
jgi:pimeloyl-ACP methyl ester carboxylesterase